MFFRAATTPKETITSESLQTQGEALFERVPVTAEKPIRDFSRLDYNEIATALKLRELGKTQTEIAQAIGCTQSTISQVLSKFSDTRLLAKQRLNNSADTLVERVVKDADVDQALEVLDRIGVAEKRQSERGSAVQVIVGVNLS